MAMDSTAPRWCLLVDGGEEAAEICDDHITGRDGILHLPIPGRIRQQLCLGQKRLVIAGD